MAPRSDDRLSETGLQELWTASRENRTNAPVSKSRRAEIQARRLGAYNRYGCVIENRMRRSTIHGFLMIGALAAGQWVEKNTSISGLYVIVAAFIILIALSFFGYPRTWSRRRKWRPRVVGQQRRPYDKRVRSNGWQQQKEPRYPAWAVYAVAAALMVGTFCAVFFWPSDQPSQAAAIATNPAPAATMIDAPATEVETKPAPAIRSEAAYPAESEPAYGRFLCDVSSITDGDTLRCSDGTRIRLHAVAARESDETCKPGHPCPSASAASATAQLSQLASGQTLQCEQTGTSYGRVTAVCWNQQNTELNCAMVNSGTTLIWPKFNAQRPICG